MMVFWYYVQAGCRVMVCDCEVGGVLGGMRLLCCRECESESVVNVVACRLGVWLRGARGCISTLVGNRVGCRGLVSVRLQVCMLLHCRVGVFVPRLRPAESRALPLSGSFAFLNPLIHCPSNPSSHALRPRRPVSPLLCRANHLLHVLSTSEPRKQKDSSPNRESPSSSPWPPSTRMARMA